MDDLKLTKEQADEIRVIVTDLNKRLDKFTDKKPDVIDQASIDKTVAAAIAKMQPTEKKMVFTNDENKEIKDDEQRIGLGKFLQMAKMNHPQLVKTIMEEQTNAQGGYLLPTELANMIIGQLNEAADVLPLMRTWTQQYPSQVIPRWLTDLTIYWVEEDATKTLSKPTFEQATSTVRKLAVIVPFTDELLADQSIVNQGVITNLVRENIATELERVALVGTTAGGDVVNGIFYVAGTNAVAQAGANLDYDDLVDVQTNTGVLTGYRKNRIWVINDAVLALIMKLRDNQNRPIWSLNLPEGGVRSTILGSPYKVSQSMVSTGIIYGDMKNTFISQLSGRNNLAVTISQSAVTPATGAVTQNAFLQDETWFRFVIRRGILVALPAAYVKLTGVA